VTGGSPIKRYYSYTNTFQSNIHPKSTPNMSDTNNRQEGKEQRPSTLTYIIVGMFSILLGVFVKSRFKALCEKEGLTEGQGCFVLFAILWILGALLMAFAWIVFLVSRLI